MTVNPYIKLQLDKAFTELCSILPIQFRNKFQEQAFISGGSIYSLWNKIEVNDYDFFVKDESFALEIIDFFKQYITEEFTKFSRGKYNEHSLLITSHAVSIDKKYQIITKFTGNPSDVVGQFDFKHNMFAYKYKGEIECFSKWEFLDDRNLHFNDGRVRDLCGTIMRLPKFVNKGFNVPKSEVAKILNKLDENGFDEREREIITMNETY